MTHSDRKPPHHPEKPRPKLDPHHGEMKPVAYPDRLDKRIGNWFYRLLTGRR